METRATAKFIKMSPRKVRLVVDIVRGLTATKALDQLKFMPKLASGPVKKLIKSGLANAINNYELDENNLFIKEIKVDEGPTIKRWLPRAHGRATTLRKRTSHISLVIAEMKDSGIKEAKKHAAPEPIKLETKAKEAEGIKAKKTSKESKINKDNLTEAGKIQDSRNEGRVGHTKIEGSSNKGFSSKIFRRKSG